MRVCRLLPHRTVIELSTSVAVRHAQRKHPQTVRVTRVVLASEHHPNFGAGGCKTNLGRKRYCPWLEPSVVAMVCEYAVPRHSTFFVTHIFRARAKMPSNMEPATGNSSALRRGLPLQA